MAIDIFDMIFRALTKLMVSFFLLVPCWAFSQDEIPKIGERIPSLVFYDVNYADSDILDVHSFAGKVLILDFFSVGCVSCFESFPKMNSIQKEFVKDVKIVLVGKEHRSIRAAFERARKGHGLNLTVAYGDSIFSRLGIETFPHIVVVDRQGIVRGITTHVNRDDVSKMVSGVYDNLDTKNVPVDVSARTIKYDMNKPLLVDGNGGVDSVFYYRSVLAPIVPGVQGKSQDFVNSSLFGNRVQVVDFHLIQLYDFAYGDTVSRDPGPTASSYGKFWRWPLVEVSDKSVFEINFSNPSNRYNYSLIVPKKRATSLFLQKVMRSDLENYFGYSVVVEERHMPCWRLVIDDNKLVNKLKDGGKRPIKEFPPYGGFSQRNISTEALIRQLWAFLQTEPPIVDDTEIKETISIDVDAVLTDVQDVRRSLKANGLNLIKSEKVMKVIVIRD